MPIALIIGLAVITAAYIALLTMFTRGWYRKMPPPPGFEGQLPQVSVIVAARNEASAVGSLLDHLAVQDFPREKMEVIVVDDGSMDATPRIVQDFIHNQGLKNFRILARSSTDGSKKQALLAGIKEACGGIILTTDADCRPAPGWISSMTHRFADRNVRLVFGPVAMRAERGFSGSFQALEFAGMVASGAGAAKAGLPFLCNGASLAFRKEAFFETGGYQSHEGYISGDDVFLLHRVKQTYGNRAVAFCDDPRALVETAAEKGLYAFLGQRARWASKTSGYRDSLTLITAFVVFLLCLTYGILFLAGIFNTAFFAAAALLYVVKTLTDLPILLGITRFNRQRSLLWGYPLFQAIYPLYIIVAGLWSPFRKKW